MAAEYSIRVEKAGANLTARYNLSVDMSSSELLASFQLNVDGTNLIGHPFRELRHIDFFTTL